MSGITLATAQAQLDLWVAADGAVAEGQEYEIAGRRLRRTDAAEISNKINFWSAKVRQLSHGGGMRVRGATPV